MKKNKNMKNMMVVLFIANMFNSNAQNLCPDNKHPHAIDLGIGVKFACCNVDASVPWEYGGYYAWGETETKDVYRVRSYKYFDRNEGDFGEYVNIGVDIAGTNFDVAHVKWGGKWRIPSKTQINLLINKCKSEWLTINGKIGRKFTGPNGKSIFIPAAGQHFRNEMCDEGSKAVCWLSTISEDGLEDMDYANVFEFDDEDVDVDEESREYGLTVRPVIAP